MAEPIESNEQFEEPDEFSPEELHQVIPETHDAIMLPEKNALRKYVENPKEIIRIEPLANPRRYIKREENQ